MSVQSDLKDLQEMNPQAFQIAQHILLLKKQDFSTAEAFESVFGTDLTPLLLASRKEFDHMILEVHKTE